MVERLEPTTVAIYPDRVVVAQGDADAAPRVVAHPPLHRRPLLVRRPSGSSMERCIADVEGSADAFASANREPRRAVLFYATDDAAAITIKRLIRAAGFDPLKAGGLADAGRIEMPGGDLHQYGLNGALLDLDEARMAVATEGVPA